MTEQKPPPGINIHFVSSQTDESSAFVEIEDDNGHGIGIGEVFHGPDGEWSIRITVADFSTVRSAAEPNACRHCNAPERMHCGRWTAKVGWHQHVQPTDEQRLSRMRARRAEKVHV